jgi:hypothetical protein
MCCAAPATLSIEIHLLTAPQAAGLGLFHSLNRPLVTNCTALPISCDKFALIDTNSAPLWHYFEGCVRGLKLCKLFILNAVRLAALAGIGKAKVHLNH